MERPCCGAAALEVLSIVAYRQPVTRAYIEQLRGVDSSNTVLNLLDKGLLEGCGRLEWWCLDWNQPSLDFYRALPAQPMEDWTVYRVAGQALTDLAQGG